MTHIPVSARRLRHILAPISLALLAACGGGDGDATDPTSTPAAANASAAQRMTIQAATPAAFRHPGIFLTQARLDAFKAATNATDPSVIKIGYQAVLDDARSEYTYAHQALPTTCTLDSAWCRWWAARSGRRRRATRTTRRRRTSTRCAG